MLLVTDACLGAVLAHLQSVSLQHAAWAISTKELAQVDAINLVVKIIYVNVLATYCLLPETVTLI
jgi:hypothetical protein